jgi:CspA family cold shock protein
MSSGSRVTPLFPIAVARRIVSRLRSISTRRRLFRRMASPQEATMAVGTVKFFNTQKGFGFIEPEGGGRDVFVHISALERAGLDHLAEGQRISFEVEKDQRGRDSVTNLRPE